MSDYVFDKIDPEEIIEKLEKLLRYLEKDKKRIKDHNEEKLTASSMDRNRSFR